MTSRASWIVLAVLAAASLALATALLPEDEFEQACTQHGGQVTERMFDDSPTVPGAHGPVPVGLPAIKKCLNPATGEVLDVR